VMGPALDEKELTPVYLLAPVEKEPAPLVIRQAPVEEELTPVYLLALLKKEPAPMVIRPAPEEEKRPLCTCKPCGEGDGPCVPASS